jgi:outer membrane biogenesis lipoprotein LolB
LVIFSFFLFLTGCVSTAPLPPFASSPQSLVELIQHIGRQKERNVTAKVRWTDKKKDTVFHAYAHATAEKISLEIITVFGTTLAFVQITPESITYEEGKKKKQFSEWHGLSYALGIALFLGNIPFPEKQEKMTLEGKNLVIQSGKELWTYSFRALLDQYWPERLLIESPSQTLQMEFDHPQENTLSPLFWSLVSDQGKLVVKISE